MSKDEKQTGQEQKLELKDCVAMKCGWLEGLLRYLVARAVLTAVLTGVMIFAMMGVATIFGTRVIITTPVTAVEKYEAENFKETLIFSTLSSWSAMFICSMFFRKKSFVEYWRRNVVGYTMHVFYGADGQSIETYIFRGRTDRLGIGGTLHGEYLYLPLGGWFRRAHYKCIKDGNLRQEDGWRFGLICPYHGLHEYWSFIRVYLYLLCDNQGNRLLVSAEEILEIISRSPSRSISDQFRHRGFELEVAQFRLERAIYRFDWVVYAATRATVAISETSRFGHSSEAEDIRRKLTEAVVAALPPGDSRIEPLAATLEKKAGRRRKGGPMTA